MSRILGDLRGVEVRPGGYLLVRPVVDVDPNRADRTEVKVQLDASDGVCLSDGEVTAFIDRLQAALEDAREIRDLHLDALDTDPTEKFVD